MIRILLFMAVIGVLVPGAALAVDAPHSPAETVNCDDCHTLHSAAGTALTKDASNSNLCISCHKLAGLASAKPFTVGMQATPGTSGTSHNWSKSMPVASSPSNAAGVRATADLSSAGLKRRLSMYGDTVTCSVCHNQHSQYATPWDPLWSLTSTRHFQLIPNDLNQMCEDCHYYRAMSYGRAKGEDPSYQADGTNTFSHPVGTALNSQGYDRSAPLDYNGTAQTNSPRYHGDQDGNTSNDLVLDSSSGIRCLSCHRIHYADSMGTTVDGP